MLGTPQKGNYSFGGMLITTPEVNYYIRGMLETTLEVNIGRMLETTLDSLKMIITLSEGFVNQSAC